MNVFVHVTLLLPVFDNLIIIPHWPVVTLEFDVSACAIEIDRLVQVVRKADAVLVWNLRLVLDRNGKSAQVK